jgi:hypothetical protein
MTHPLQHPVTVPPAAPYSSLIRKATGVCLILAALTNGLSQYVHYLVAGRLEWLDQIRWGADNPTFQRADATILMISALFMPLGLLGIAQVTRWSARRLTLVGTPLMLWGMWGFHNILVGGMIAGPIATRSLGEEGALSLNEGMMTDTWGFFLAPLPHMLGTLPGVVLLTIAAWRSGAFPKLACAAILVFLVWDYFLPPVGPLLEPHLLLFVGWTWLGVSLVRMPHAVWSGASPEGATVDASADVQPSAASY